MIIGHVQVIISTAVLQTHLLQFVFHDFHSAFSTGFPKTQTQNKRIEEVFSRLMKMYVDHVLLEKYLDPEVLSSITTHDPKGAALSTQHPVQRLHVKCPRRALQAHVQVPGTSQGFLAPPINTPLGSAPDQCRLPTCPTDSILSFIWPQKRRNSKKTKTKH